MSTAHNPVLLNEVLHFISPRAGETYIDGTFGSGGYTKALLAAADCTVQAIDQDQTVQKYADEISKEFAQRMQLHINKFSQMAQIFAEQTADAIVLDLGLSSMQLAEGERGFSFMKDGPLDMRMSQQQHINAATMVNAIQEKELADIIYHNSDERYSRKIAAAIVKYRQSKLIETTQELATIVRSVVPKSKVEKIDPATRTFQALRIWVNNELQELTQAIVAAAKLLKIGGRLVIVSFHSLEDKIVKEKFNALCGKQPSPSRHVPTLPSVNDPQFAFLHKKIITARPEEVDRNPRARSARLRAIQKIK